MGINLDFGFKLAELDIIKNKLGGGVLEVQYFNSLRKFERDNDLSHFPSFIA